MAMRIFADPRQPTLVPYDKNLDLMKLKEEVTYYAGTGDGIEKGFVIRVPAGFKTDGASIPYGVRWIVGQPFWPRFQIATVIHDYIYQYQTVSRKSADYVFLALLEQNGVEPWRRKLMWAAVRVFGHFAWKKRKRALV